MAFQIAQTLSYTKKNYLKKNSNISKMSKISKWKVDCKNLTEYFLSIILL